MRSAAKKNDAPAATALVEEAVNLVRSAPPSAWGWYLAGAVPWVLGLGHFWATASWFAPRPEESLWHALGLVALYLWLKVAQAKFCAALRARRLGAEPARWNGADWMRVAARQARAQGWAAVVLPVASVLTLPLCAAWMYFENITALAATREAGGDTLEVRARREAMRWPGPAHLALLLFSGLWLCAWVNVASAFYVAPWLARTLLGVESLFGLSGWSAFNSTFLALVTLLTWLVCDPLSKAYHVLRTFYGETLRTGEDLRLEFAPARRGGVARVAMFALAAWLGAAGLAGNLRAAEAAPAIAPAELDEALDRALRAKEFQWRLAPLPEPEAAEGGDGPVKGFVRQGVKILLEMAGDLRDTAKRFGEWLDGLFKGKEKRERAPRVAREGGTGNWAKPVLYILLAACLGALVWVLWLGWRQRGVAPRKLEALSAAALPPDLNDERLEASRLPPDEWLELAREQMARGEWRLALRALYLGALARLGAQGLVTLARAKTNLDYERELSRRAAGRDGVVAGFRSRRMEFERVWYGRDAAEEARVRTWFDELSAERAGEEVRR